MVEGPILGRRCILTYEERLGKREAEAGKRRLEDGGCQVGVNLLSERTQPKWAKRRHFGPSAQTILTALRWKEKGEGGKLRDREIEEQAGRVRTVREGNARSRNGKEKIYDETRQNAVERWLGRK